MIKQAIPKEEHIPEHLKGKELFKYLVDNKDKIIKSRTSKSRIPTTKDCVAGAFYNSNLINKAHASVKDIPEDATELELEPIMNTAWWCDYDNDVLIPDCWAKSIKERESSIPHLHDHVHTTKGRIGDVKRIYSLVLPLRDIGIDMEGTTQCLLFRSNLIKEYNPIVFLHYRRGNIKQHSIGLKYIKLELAINDPEFEDEYAVWLKYYDKIINKDYVNEQGYFWAVKEIILLEGSGVLFGSNEITGIYQYVTPEQPPKGTGGEPTGSKGMFASIGIS